jgi:hypothetical protein
MTKCREIGRGDNGRDGKYSFGDRDMKLRGWGIGAALKFKLRRG